jgi:hypothetical protein
MSDNAAWCLLIALIIAATFLFVGEPDVHDVLLGKMVGCE